MHLPRLIITAGEPAGIGAEIIVKALSRSWQADVVVVGDPHLLSACAKRFHLPLKIECITPQTVRCIHHESVLRVLPVSLREPATLGQLNAHNAPYVMETLETAHRMTMHEPHAAMVTAPVHKRILSDSSVFHGHTEWLRDACGVDQTLMLFVTPQFKVALFTTHISLREVPHRIQADALRRTVLMLRDEMQARFHLSHPRIAVCGLNPHAGEEGLLGREEIDIIQPVLHELREQGVDVRGCFPADTIFTPHRLSECDVILGMYHDQVLPVVKYSGFGSCVNVTLGLPYIRTSVDHGTALDIASLGVADESGLCAAMTCALDLLDVS